MLSSWGCDYLQGSLFGLATTERPWANGNGASRAAG
jgi:EAL domain-containing protein (putative c-di-GMP-specific phosphodiesterase class I)